MKKWIISILLILIACSQIANAENNSWMTQPQNMVGAEFSITLPEGYYLLNANTKEYLLNNQELYENLMERQDEDYLEHFTESKGNDVMNTEGLLRIGFEIHNADADQSMLWMMEDSFESAVRSEMQDNGCTGIECGLYEYGENLFLCAFGQGESFGKPTVYGHFITVDSKGRGIEFWTYHMDRTTIESILSSFAPPIAQSNAVNLPVYDTFDEVSSLNDIYIWNDSLTFIKNDQAVSILSMYGEYDLPDSGELELPSSISGLPVVQIGKKALYGSKDIVRVTVPSSVQMIRSGAFDKMDVLTDVILSEGVQIIENTFNQCPKLFNVVVPASVTSISEGAFDSVNPYFHLTVEKGSYGETYAIAHSIPYVLAEDRSAVSLAPGNTVSLGTYNGKKVEWLVLETEENKALLLAKDVLELQQFSEKGNALWKNSNINHYLNNELLYNLFSMEESELITAHRVYDPASPYSLSGLPGESDVCHLFLLSYFEARDLLPADEHRAASEDWWLRTSRDYSEYTHYVNANGEIREGREIYNALGVRPALWVRTENANGIIEIVDDNMWVAYHEEDDGVFGVGDIIQLGAYEQDNDQGNGSEPLDWIVLEINDTSATLISKYCIDVQQYHTTDASINWGQSSLRNWLNSEFLNTAFSMEEQAALIQTRVENFDTDAAKNSMMYSYMIDPVVSYDMVWILDDDEADRYLPELEDKLAYITKYANSRGAASNNEGYGNWLLRTDKNDKNRANIMLPYEGGASVVVTRSDASIRPVIKIDLARLGIIDAEVQEYVADWNNPYMTITSQGRSNPENGTLITDRMFDKVLRTENQSGGWFRIIAPEDGDYAFSVLAPVLGYDSFTMEVSVNGEKRASLVFDRSTEVQTHTLTGIKKGDVIAWWDNDNSGRGYTMLDPYSLMITRYEPGAFKNTHMDEVPSPTQTLGFISPTDGSIVPVGQKLQLEWTEIPGAKCYSVYAYPASSTSVWDWAEFLYDGECSIEIPRSTLLEANYRIELNAWKNDRFISGEEIFNQSIEISTYNKFENVDNSTNEEPTATDGLLISGDYSYKLLEDGTIAFVGFNGHGDLKIPESIDGYSVTAIADGACYWNSALDSVSIPGSVRTIGANAFSWCMSLKSVTIAEGVTRIGDSAFCNNSSLYNIEFPSSVTHIGKYVCSDCSELAYATLPTQLISIGEGVFSSCESLSEITIPAGVRIIPDSAFFCCTNLKSVQFSEGLIEICDMAFYGCEALTNVSIPNTVTSIGEWAFSFCTNLSTLSISDSTMLGDGAFSDCSL